MSIRDPNAEAASELRWYFRWSCADVGFKAQGYGGSGGGPRTEADTTTDRQVEAAGKAKRIRRGIAKMPDADQAIVKLAYEGHGRANAVLVALGDVAELVRVDPAAHAMHESNEDREVAASKAKGGKRTRHPFDEWLADACAAGKAGVGKLRDAAEARLAAAVAAYATVRVPRRKGDAEPPDEPPGAKRGPYAPRKGVAEDFGSAAFGSSNIVLPDEVDVNYAIIPEPTCAECGKPASHGSEFCEQHRVLPPDPDALPLHLTAPAVSS